MTKKRPRCLRTIINALVDECADEGTVALVAVHKKTALGILPPSGQAVFLEFIELKARAGDDDEWEITKIPDSENDDTEEAENANAVTLLVYVLRQTESVFVVPFHREEDFHEQPHQFLVPEDVDIITFSQRFRESTSMIKDQPHTETRTTDAGLFSVRSGDVAVQVGGGKIIFGKSVTIPERMRPAVDLGLAIAQNPEIVDAIKDRFFKKPGTT